MFLCGSLHKLTNKMYHFVVVKLKVMKKHYIYIYTNNNKLCEVGVLNIHI